MRDMGWERFEGARRHEDGSIEVREGLLDVHSLLDANTDLRATGDDETTRKLAQAAHFLWEALSAEQVRHGETRGKIEALEKAIVVLTEAERRARGAEPPENPDQPAECPTCLGYDPTCPGPPPPDLPPGATHDDAGTPLPPEWMPDPRGKLPRGWLGRHLRAVAEDAETWPDWMRQQVLSREEAVGFHCPAHDQRYGVGERCPECEVRDRMRAEGIDPDQPAVSLAFRPLTEEQRADARAFVQAMRTGKPWPPEEEPVTVVADGEVIEWPDGSRVTVVSGEEWTDCDGRRFRVIDPVPRPPEPWTEEPASPVDRALDLVDRAAFSFLSLLDRVRWPSK